jgi:alpha-tubulin suppressor-like RCC1 family protein
VDSGDYNTVNLGLIEGLTGIVDIVAASMYSLFLKSNGIVYSCGTNRKGQLGRIAEQGYIEGINLGPIEGLSDIESVHGSTSSLFLASEGRVLSCGENLWGQIGRVIDSGSNDTVNLGETRIAA